MDSDFIVPPSFRCENLEFSLMANEYQSDVPCYFVRNRSLLCKRLLLLFFLILTDFVSLATRAPSLPRRDERAMG